MPGGGGGGGRQSGPLMRGKNMQPGGNVAGIMAAMNGTGMRPAPNPGELLQPGMQLMNGPPMPADGEAGPMGRLRAFGAMNGGDPQSGAPPMPMGQQTLDPRVFQMLMQRLGRRK